LFNLILLIYVLFHIFISFRLWHVASTMYLHYELFAMLELDQGRNQEKLLRVAEI
jgi:hypothetical protein